MQAFVSITIPRYYTTLVILLIVAWQSACSVESNLDNDPIERHIDNGAEFNNDNRAGSDNNVVQRVLNATSNESWVYFDLDTASVIYPENPQADSDWDIAFQRFKIKLNGGVSGPAGVAVSALHNTTLASAETSSSQNLVYDRALSELSDEELLLLGDNLFFSVCASGYDDDKAANYCLADNKVNRDHLNPATSAYAFLTQGSGQLIAGDGSDSGAILGWYDYFFEENHILRPADDVWLLRSSEGNDFFFEMLGYYGLNEGDAESGTVAFQYKSLSAGIETPDSGGGQLLLELSADSTSGAAPLTVNFSAEIAGAEGTTVWLWDFDNGYDSEEAGVVEHTFDEGGTFKVLLAVTDERDVTVEKALTIVVTDTNEPPLANAGEDQSLQLGSDSAITLMLDGSMSSDLDGEIVSYIWQADNGIDPEDTVMPEIEITTGGAYAFTLTVIDDDGDIATDTVNISVDLPVAVIDIDEKFGLNNSRSFSFDGSASADADGVIVSWLWDFGDGNSSELKTLDHRYEDGGSYTVSLTVIDDNGLTNMATETVVAASLYSAIQDTYIYEFFGNQGVGTGDSSGISVWNHEAGHGGQGLVQFDSAWASDAAVLSGNYTATLNLYSYCQTGGFIGACAGEAAPVTTDIVLQGSAWSEGDSALDWGDISQSSSPSVSFTQATSGEGWISVDITSLVNAWVFGIIADNGLALTQEAYGVVRNSAGKLTVSQFCDSESTNENCTEDLKPYIEIKVTPP